MTLILQHAKNEGPGSLGVFLKQSRKTIKTIKLYAMEKMPASLTGVRAIIAMGGPMNVYEEKKFAFLKDEDRFLRKAIASRVPILGICLGAQLLAKALGAKVNKAKRAEIGWKKVSLTAEGKKDLLFRGLHSPLTVFQWHQDTFEMPRGAIHLASAKACVNQAFRYGNNCYGLQFHTEVNAELISAWTKEFQANPNPQIMRNVRGILRGFCLLQGAYKEQAEKIHRNYFVFTHTPH